MVLFTKRDLDQLYVHKIYEGECVFKIIVNEWGLSNIAMKKVSSGVRNPKRPIFFTGWPSFFPSLCLDI